MTKCEICDEEFTTSGIYDCTLIFPNFPLGRSGITSDQNGLVHIHNIALVDKRLITFRGAVGYWANHAYRRLRWRLWGRFRQKGIVGWKFQSR